MNRSRFLLIGVGIPAALFCLIVLTILFIPNRELKGVVSRALETQGYTMRAAGFGLAFPIGLRAKELEIDSDRGALLKFGRATAKLRILPLFTGKVVIAFRGTIGKGEVNGEFASLKKGVSSLEIADVRLDEIPFFQSVTGAQVKGELNVKGSFRGKQNDATGELRLAVKDAQLQGVKIGGMPLPDASYKTVQGMLRIGGGKATLDSLNLEGDGLYVRLKGDMPLTTPMGAAPLNLTLELMPKAEFLEKQKFVFLLLLKYQSSPGHYQIPVRGTLGKPALL